MMIFKQRRDRYSEQEAVAVKRETIVRITPLILAAMKMITATIEISRGTILADNKIMTQDLVIILVLEVIMTRWGPKISSVVDLVTNQQMDSIKVSVQWLEMLVEEVKLVLFNHNFRQQLWVEQAQLTLALRLLMFHSLEREQWKDHQLALELKKTRIN